MQARQLLTTPANSRRLAAGVWLLVLLGPLMNVYHFMSRAAYGHYSPGADSIGIPIFVHTLFIFPFELFALRGLDFYRGGLSLWCFSRQQRLFATVSTIATVCPFGLWCAAMSLDGLSAGFFGVSVFYALRLYAFLLLRVGLMEAYNQSADEDDDED